MHIKQLTLLSRQFFACDVLISNICIRFDRHVQKLVLIRLQLKTILELSSLFLKTDRRKNNFFCLPRLTVKSISRGLVEFGYYQSQINRQNVSNLLVIGIWLVIFWEINRYQEHRLSNINSFHYSWTKVSHIIAGGGTNHPPSWINLIVRFVGEIYKTKTTQIIFINDNKR